MHLVTNTKLLIKGLLACMLQRLNPIAPGERPAVWLRDTNRQTPVETAINQPGYAPVSYTQPNLQQDCNVTAQGGAVVVKKKKNKKQHGET